MIAEISSSGGSRETAEDMLNSKLPKQRSRFRRQAKTVAQLIKMMSILSVILMSLAITSSESSQLQETAPSNIEAQTMPPSLAANEISPNLRFNHSLYTRGEF